MSGHFIRSRESDIIRNVDVLITRRVSAELDALKIFRPAPSAWGLLIGHRRGPRIVVESIFPAAAGAALPPPGPLDDLDRRFGGKVIGFFAVRPGAALKKSLLGPYFYGRVLLEVHFSRGGILLKAFAVEFDGAFFLAPVPLESGPKGEAHE